VLTQAGYEVDDVNWAIITYDNGAVVNLGVSYALPEKIGSAQSDPDFRSGI
jgi:hypothetical protein